MQVGPQFSVATVPWIKEPGRGIVMLRASRLLPLLVHVALTFILSACGQAGRSSDPSAGAKMLWLDHSLLAFDPVSNSWISRDPVKSSEYADCAAVGACSVLAPTEVVSGVLGSNPPIQNPVAAGEYCGNIGASGVLTSSTGYWCQFKDPSLYPPSRR